MDPNVPQFEKFWRDKISKQISLYLIGNMHEMSDVEIHAVEHVQKFVKQCNL
jgi:hypothetical protein